MKNTFKKATSKEKKSFARRFSLEQWMEICNKDQFTEAFECGDLETCRAIIANQSTKR